jgi:pyruvate-formate lyase
MSIKVTLELSNGVVEQAQQVSQSVHRSLEDVLADSLETLWPVVDSASVRKVYEDVSLLTDEDVLALANLKMSTAQNERYEDLLAKSKEEDLNQTEQLELLSLMQISRLGLLRKAQGLSEAVRRGLRKPLHS